MSLDKHCSRLTPSLGPLTRSSTRYRATKLLRDWQQKAIEDGTFNDSEKKIETIDCIVKKYTNKADVYADQLIENIQRVGLTEFEISDAIMKYKSSYEKEPPDHLELKQSDIAKTFGKSKIG